MKSRYAASAVVALVILSAPALSPSAMSAPALAFCKADVARLCPGLRPGGGRIIECLKAHKEEVSIGCAKELKAMKASRGM